MVFMSLAGSGITGSDSGKLVDIIAEVLPGEGCCGVCFFVRFYLWKFLSFDRGSE